MKIPVDVVKVLSTGLNSISEIIDSANGVNRIVLMTHPQDIVAIVAARILSASGCQLIFYNHADHLFSYGVSAAHIVCEVSAYGEEINQRGSRVRGASVRLGIPLRPVDLSLVVSKETLSMKNGYKTVLTVGNSYKYKPDENYYWADFIDELLARRDDVNVVFVGPTGKEPWWIERKEKWNERVVFLGNLPHAEYLQLLKTADVYVDSYPITGGTAFPEALLSGKPCVGLAPPVQGYSLADELRVETPAQLAMQVQKILNVDSDVLQVINIVRKRVAAAQSEDVFKERVQQIYEGQLSAISKVGVHGLQGIDTHWLENKWCANGEVIWPRRRTIATLPLFHMIQILVSLLWLKVMCINKRKLVEQNPNA